jgi:hypothetical protein
MKILSELKDARDYGAEEYFNLTLDFFDKHVRKK